MVSHFLLPISKTQLRRTSLSRGGFAIEYGTTAKGYRFAGSAVSKGAQTAMKSSNSLSIAVESLVLI